MYGGDSSPAAAAAAGSAAAARARCRSDADKKPVGSDAYFSAPKFTWGGNTSSKKGNCACACGGVLGI